MNKIQIYPEEDYWILIDEYGQKWKLVLSGHRDMPLLIEIVDREIATENSQVVGADMRWEDRDFKWKERKE